MRNHLLAGAVLTVIGAIAAGGASCGTEFTSTGGGGGGTGGDVSGSGSTSSSGSTSTSSSSSSGSSGSEDCFDGVDNDDDGKVDCADPDCDPVAVCVPDPGGGWAGPNAGTVTTPGVEIPCPGGWPTKEVTLPAGTLKFDPAGCGCECGPIQDACNGKATVVPFLQGCISPGAQGVLAPAGQCQAANGPILALGAAANGPLPDPSAGCAPMRSVDIGEVMGTQTATFCSAPDTLVQGGCSAGNLCAPKAAAPYKICIAGPGPDACPSGYTQEAVVYPDITDTRDCSDCQCQPQGVSCGGKVDLYAGAGCSGAVTSIPVPAQCSDNAGFTIASVKYTPMTNGSCNHLPVSPIGTVTGAPYVVCCQ